MQYHIQTAPVWDAYKTEKGCPLCALIAAKEKRLIKSYLNENVMDEHFRMRSNALGFCPEHVRMLYAGENKLGLALQLETRAAYLYKDVLKSIPADKKSAKKTADALKAHCGCVICDELDEFLPRYYMTIAQIYDNEAEFPALFAAATHCVKHATELFAAAEHAKKSAGKYLADLHASLTRELKRTEKELRIFCDCFDHLSSDKPDATAIPRATELLITKDIKK